MPDGIPEGKRTRDKLHSPNAKVREHPLHQIVEEFVDGIESLWQTLPLFMSVLGMLRRDSSRKMLEFLERIATNKTVVGSQTSYTFPIESFREVERLKRRRDSHEYAYGTTPQSHVVSVVSKFDWLIGRTLSWAYETKPEWLNESDKKLSFSELSRFKSIEDARAYVVEKEVEALLRKSHIEQFVALERRLDTTLRKGLSAWPDFVELTERRNLFVHTGGIVSSQYLDVCKEQDVRLPSEIVVGSSLGVDQPYFEKACSCLSEIAVKLVNVVWRKLKKDEREIADHSLNEICYGFIASGRYKLAQRVLLFALDDLKKYSSEQVRLTLVINLAQAFKHEGAADKCKETLAKEDWSATRDIFHLAVAVLNDDYSNSASLMRRIGDSTECDRGSYRYWPLFEQFRKTDEFRSAYRDVFKEEFVLAETVTNPGQDTVQVKDTPEQALQSEGGSELRPDSSANTGGSRPAHAASRARGAPEMFRPKYQSRKGRRNRHRGRR